MPLIITGDEGCGKTHLIIKWLMEFNSKDTGQNRAQGDDKTSKINSQQHNLTESGDLDIS